jgi:lysine-specific demethylase/histidyl-hydroxylase NO66
VSEVADWREGPLPFLVAPLDSETFLSDVYEREPLVHASGDAARFAGLLTLARLDRFLAEADLRDNMVRLANHAAPVALSSYLGDDGRLDGAAIAREYGRGSTIVLNELHDSIPELGAFCRAVEEAFSSQVTTNVYLTPPANQGFPPHYDNHDVFVLQISGRKLWRLWETAADTPYRGERFEHSGFQAEKVSREFILGPGDSAYIPRGLMHDAENVGDEPSLHVTVGLFTKKWADLMLEAVSEIALAEPDFRRSLPAGFADREFDRAAAERRFAGLIERVGAAAEMDGAFDLLTDNFLRSRRPDVRGVVAGGPAGRDSAYRLRRFVPWTVADDDGRIVLVGPGGDIQFEAEDGDALDVALSGGPFTLADLKCASPESVLAALWSHGYLERAPG